ncbi:MAG: hypothetical protein MI924_11015, partial [Chloroflexales bacterium]|nr:hypothetical protein [Chloroflexales bacterium]
MRWRYPTVVEHPSSTAALRQPCTAGRAAIGDQMRNAYDLDDVTQPRIPGCNPQSSVGNVHGNGFRPQAGVFAHT